MDDLKLLKNLLYFWQHKLADSKSESTRKLARELITKYTLEIKQLN